MKKQVLLLSDCLNEMIDVLNALCSNIQERVKELEEIDSNLFNVYSDLEEDEEK